MSDFYPDHFKDKKRKSPGESEQDSSSRIVQIFRLFKILPGPDEPGDTHAVERVGVLLTRRFPWIHRYLTPEK